MSPIGNSMNICLPLYQPHSSSGVFILFVVVCVMCAWPNDNWIKIPFPVLISYIYICFVNSLSMSFEVTSYRWVLSDIRYEQISCTQNVKIYISVYLTYHQCDTISLLLNLDQCEKHIVWLSIFKLKVKLGSDNRSKQKCYCKSDDATQR